MDSLKCTTKKKSFLLSFLKNVKDEKNQLSTKTRKHTSEKILRQNSEINFSKRRNTDTTIKRKSGGSDEDDKRRQCQRDFAKESWMTVLHEAKLYINTDAYEFDFDVVMHTKALRDLFTKYLSTIQNEEQVKFLTAVETYRTIFCEKQRIFKAENIYQIYLHPGSSCEINISNSTRQQVQNGLQNEALCDETLFDDVYMNIYSNLKGDSFSRFLKSFVFQEFCRTIDDNLFKSFARLKI
eukprot:gene4884-8478_t